MATTEELLEQLEQEASAMSDEQVYCVIDPDTRQVSVPAEYQLLGVESDEKVERIWFQCPKIVGDNIDLSQRQLRINYQNANSQKDQYIVTDVQTDGDNIVFSWLLSRKVTAYQGNVSFIMCAVKVSGETIQNEWNTTLATAKVLEGLEVDTPSPSEEQSDVITQLLQIMADTSEQAVSDVGTAKDAAIAAIQSQQSTSVQAVQTASSSAQTAIETKGNTVMESIPDDYTELSETVEQLGRTKAPVIKKTVTGENIELEDAGSVPLQNIKLFGRSSQAKYEGKNLAEVIKTGTATTAGVTININEDGSYTLNGASTGASVFLLNQPTSGDVSGFPTLFSLASGKKYRIIDCQLCKRNSRVINGMDAGGTVYEPEADEDIVGVRAFIASGASYDGKRIYYPGVWEDEEGNDTEWEPYTGGKPSPSSEYPQPILSSSIENTGTGEHEVEVMSQSVNLFTGQSQATISIANPFSGITVSSGGNYTDEDGQQYVCDEIQADLEAGTGVYIQRIAHVVFDGSEDEKWSLYNAGWYIPGGIDGISKTLSVLNNSLSDIFRRIASGDSEIGFTITDTADSYSPYIRNTGISSGVEWREFLSQNNMTFVFALEIPIITALTSEQIEALRQLQTYATITNITAGGETEAGKEITYGADTKAYIDQKIAEIAQSLAATQNALLQEE